MTQVQNRGRTSLTEARTYVAELAIRAVTPGFFHSPAKAPPLLAELAAHLEGRKTKPADSLLVADKNGSPIPQNRFSQTWARGVRRAGLPPGTRFHDLRHTYASALIASGCSVKVVEAHLGHKSAAIPLDTYSHLWPQDDRARPAIQTFLDRGASTACHDEASG
jgi:integrase